jgi:hypothetical protein
VRLADQLGIPENVCAVWPKGQEPDHIVQHLEQDGSSHMLEPALILIGRGDLVRTGRLIVLDPGDELKVLDDRSNSLATLPRELPTLSAPQMAAVLGAADARPWKRLHTLAESCYRCFRSLYLDLLRCLSGERPGGRHATLASFQQKVGALEAHFEFLRGLASQVHVPDPVHALAGLECCLGPLQLSLSAHSRHDEFRLAVRLVERLCELFLQALRLADSLLEEFFKCQ